MGLIRAGDAPSDLQQLMDKHGIQSIRACRGDLSKPLATDGIRRIVEEVIALDAARREQPDADAAET